VVAWTASALASLVLLALPLAAYAATATVEIRDFSFQPKTVSVTVGDTVTWINYDTTAHTATSTGVWDTGSFGAGASRSTTFARPGTYLYFCLLHSIMFGTVVVEEPGAARAVATPAPAPPPPSAAPPTPTAEPSIAAVAAPAEPPAAAIVLRPPSESGPGPVIVAGAAMAIVALGAFAWRLTRQI
jgi:plastocyanin